MSESEDVVKWTVITVAYNSALTLRAHWSSFKPSAEVEWLVVDNDSSDDSIEAAADLGATVLSLPQNVGFSAANNVALKVARGRYIAFINPDVIVDVDDLPTLEEKLAVGRVLLAPQLVNADGSLQPNGRGAPTLVAKIANRLMPPSRGVPGYLLSAMRDESIHAFWLMGAAVMIAKEDMVGLGGWNEQFFLYYEDSELCVRAWDAGLTVLVDGRIRWRHSWARETIRFAWQPWRRELSAAFKFYSLHPSLILGGKRARVRYAHSYNLSGRPVSPGRESPDEGLVK